MNKFFSHLRTVNAHRREVRKLCFKCGLYWQGLTHDLSKYSPTEFINGVKFYTGTASPHCGERKAYGYSKAWLHHKGRNKHHAEYWNDHAPVDMPRKYLAEMICDRVAACKTYLKENYTDAAAWEYYDSHREENQFSNASRGHLEFFLLMLHMKGEKETFEYIRHWVKYNLNVL
jgi:hypothetical protein